jgi:hypothetical protein
MRHRDSRPAQSRVVAVGADPRSSLPPRGCLPSPTSTCRRSVRIQRSVRIRRSVRTPRRNRSSHPRRPSRAPSSSLACAGTAWPRTSTTAPAPTAGPAVGWRAACTGPRTELGAASCAVSASPSERCRPGRWRRERRRHAAGVPRPRHPLPSNLGEQPRVRAERVWAVRPDHVTAGARHGAGRAAADRAVTPLDAISERRGRTATRRDGVSPNGCHGLEPVRPIVRLCPCGVPVCRGVASGRGADPGGAGAEPSSDTGPNLT